MLVILNPAARGGAGRQLQPELQRELTRRGLRFDLVTTSGPRDATRLARQAVADGADTVVAVGGDGTMHEVANGILQAADAGLGSDTALGLVPIGTGNDFVKAIPGTSRRETAYDTLAAGRRYACDVGQVTWGDSAEYFINAMGTGIDVEVVRQILAMPRRTGKLVYVAGLVQALRRYRPILLRVDTGTEVLEQRVMTIAVTNGNCIGGLFHICPQAVPDDGALDLCVVADVRPLRIPGMAVRLIRGRHVGQPEVMSRRAQRIRITVLDDTPMFMQLDGELHQPVGIQEMEVSIHPARMPVIAAAVPGGRLAGPVALKGDAWSTGS
ncbi:MAG: diacylglycerol kinase family lipid kinase [Gemmatimonadetes bacterium]|nr:diacylglycerol kinase family lipid kinase [Gemmatimonadota bacterium]